MDTEMHKEYLQAVGDPTSLKVASEERANPQLSSHSTAEADPGLTNFLSLDSLTDEPIIISNESDEEKDADTNVDTYHVEPEDTPASHPLYPKSEQAKAEVTFLKARPSYPNANQLAGLLVTSLKYDLSNLLASHDFASFIPNELKELPSKITQLSKEIQELKRHVQVPCFTELNFISLSEASDFSYTSKSSEQGQATASPVEGEKNTNPATKDAKTTNLYNYIIDLLGIDTVTRALSYYKYIGWTIKVIPNIKVNDLHLAEWKEVVQACPDRKEKGWKTIYGLIKTRMEYLNQTEKELKIDFNKPLKKQVPLNELNDLANKKRKRTGNLKDHSRSTKKHKSSVQHEKEVL
nr:hypothetical protein [Tanacetum cinerariifolium]